MLQPSRRDLSSVPGDGMDDRGQTEQWDAVTNKRSLNGFVGKLKPDVWNILWAPEVLPYPPTNVQPGSSVQGELGPPIRSLC